MIADQQFLDEKGLLALLRCSAIRKDLSLRQRDADVAFDDKKQFPSHTADAVNNLASAHYKGLN